MHADPRWSVGSPNTAPAEGLHQTVARQARCRPGAAAVVEGPRTITYAQLDAAADAWAAGLVAAGVRPGDRVPILLPRSADLVVALLAVLKTGAAYCLLPPDWPAPRLDAVLTDLRPPLVVTGTEPAGDLAVPAWPISAAPVSAGPGFRSVAVAAADPCCVFFTSGTTGRPKGVVSPHGATARLLQPGGFARFDHRTVIPLAAATPWDAFSLELWSALLNGGTSVIVADPYLSASALRHGVARHGANTAWCTASLFNLIMDETPDAFEGLDQVMIGGERLSVPHVRRFLALHPDTVLLNGYGPVECTVFATTHRIRADDCERPGGIPLGRPVPGTEVYVLDGQRPCAVGETGEICLAGDGLAIEYLGDPALTAAKFTRIRVGDREVRVYRTGDLGTWDEDGLLRLTGRADRQLKIRGNRVEPAEVERQIEQLLSDVRHCRVVARATGRGDRELVAFCVPVRDGDPLPDATSRIRDALVAYHRPAAVVSVGAFPLTAQGKLDERALLALLTSPAVNPDPAAGCDPATLGDPVLRDVAECSAAVLGVGTIPLDTPFPEMGLTSLDAGRVCARLSARTGIPVPVSWLYEYPTVTGLARRLSDATAVPGAGREAALSVPDDDAAPLTAVQVMQLTRELLNPADRTGHCLLSWVVEGELDRSALSVAIAAVHLRHESLRAAYLLDPEPAAYPDDVPAPALTVLPPQAGVDAALAAAREVLAAPLAPQDAQVWHTVLVPVDVPEPAAPTAVFGCAVHHVAFDGWSEAVLANDLSTAYRIALGGANPDRVAVALGPGPALADLVRAELARCRLAEPERRLAEVRASLAGVPPLRWSSDPSTLDGDGTGSDGRVAFAEFAAADGATAFDPSTGTTAPAAIVPIRSRRQPERVEVRLAADALAAVDAAAAAANVTRFVVLLALWAASVADVTGQRDVAFGVPVARRDDPALERAIGCHITMVCLRLRDAACAGDTGAVRIVGRTVQQMLAAQSLAGFHLLGEAGRPPAYQTLFAYQNNAVPELELPDARVTFVRQPYLDLPLELHAELWPDGDGLRLEVTYNPAVVTEKTAADLAKHFSEYVYSQATGAVRP
ncbi:amino acid adenylation domain-containing protein [Micromonospora zamorensis]|uniref:amino acid adenylation domain-containing protein n=1 Tax=Micromonospora zamorensis TaxID=709883 RepID=UPI002E282251|nr:amino acid adenylation domain-containing protein [Micromonospora zamorensis]